MVALVLVLFHLIWLLEEMPLQLQFVLQVLLLLNLSKIQVLLNHEVDVRGWLPLPYRDLCIGALLLVEIRLVLILGLDLPLQEVILEFFPEINPVSLDEDAELEGVEAFQIWHLITLQWILGAAGLRGDAVVDVVLLFLVVV